MKSFNLLLLLLIAAVSVKAQGVKFSADKPAAGSTVKFTYDPKGTNLQNLADIQCNAFNFSKTTSPKTTKIELVKEGEVYHGSFSSTDSTTMLALAFYVDDQKDEVPAGYILEFTKAGKVPAEAYVNEAFLYGSAGNYYLGLTLDAEKAASFYKKAFALKPELKEKQLTSYLSMEYKANKENGSRLIRETISSTLKNKTPKEEDLGRVVSLYGLLKQKKSADSIRSILLKKFPSGPFAYGADMDAMYAIKDPALQEKKAIEIVAKFKLDPSKKAEATKLDDIYSILANTYLKEKQYDKFEYYVNKVNNKLSKASFFNSYAWPSAEKNEHVDYAAKLSKQSLELLEQAKNDDYPYYYASKEDYIKNINGTYGMFADTYALLLYRQGKYKEALAVQEKAIPLYSTVTPDVAGRYVTYLIKNGQHEKAYAEAEKLIVDGKGSDSLKNDFKKLYVILKKEGSYEQYIARIEKEAAAKERAVWMKKMINMPAPAFSLANLKGETVSLASLKGKIVVLDYWATWCGPCVASFPGMQKAMAKYANNPNVVFLFVNTWQTEDNREKVVTDFVAEKKLNFNILYDTKNKQDPSKFDVVSAYKVDGIPTKFIIDGDGNIRFKAVGFSGSDDGVVKEIDSMIGLLSSKEASK